MVKVGDGEINKYCMLLEVQNFHKKSHFYSTIIYFYVKSTVPV